jgi:hypothetical protein
MRRVDAYLSKSSERARYIPYCGRGECSYLLLKEKKENTEQKAVSDSPQKIETLT